jgi:hypothetical protein
MQYLETLRRLLVILALALWFGGFTFYSLLLGSKFIGEQAGQWLHSSDAFG